MCFAIALVLWRASFSPWYGVVLSPNDHLYQNTHKNLIARTLGDMQVFLIQYFCPIDDLVYVLSHFHDIYTIVPQMAVLLRSPAETSTIRLTQTVASFLVSFTIEYLANQQSAQGIAHEIKNTHHYGHYTDVIMTTMAFQITSLTIVYSTVYSDADQRKHQSSASLAFVRGIHRGPVNSSYKWPVTRKMFPFDDVIMEKDNNPQNAGVYSLNPALTSFLFSF